jgi:AraC-like DNA-binding protein
MEPLAFEKHYRVKELAGLWGLSPKNVSRIFAGEAGVIRVLNNTGQGKRKYTTVSIPQSVASRVHERLGSRPMRSTSQIVKAVRIIRLADVASISPAGLRATIKLKAGKK